ncbi:MAG: acyl-CoA dehydratase activase-related protein [Actinomycetota bacterium]|nr:acyl-CoA dehydratase activase-related protein [Actinomycetota bacterium]
MKVGIPGGLLYFRYGRLWTSFLQALGAEVVESGETTRSILNSGVSKAENESCLPVKVFYGHVMSLKDRVDALFVPRLVSVKKRTHTCPKMLGLPDMARAATEEEIPIIGPTIDFHSGLWSNYRTVYSTGRIFTTNPWRIIGAGIKAWREHRQYLKGLTLGLTPRGTLEVDESRRLCEGRELRVAVIGHHYNVYDTFTTMSLLDRLKGMGVDVITAEMVPERLRNKELKRLPKTIYWSYEQEIAGAILACAKYKLADGIIFMISFPCGPDSIIRVLCEQENKLMGNIPMMTLVMDEHTGEGGFLTRIEAFVDMLRWKKDRVGESEEVMVPA